MHMNTDELAIIFKRKREALTLTQKELSDMSGVHLRSINNIESGKSNPSWDTIIKLAEVLKLEILIRS